MGLRFYLEQRGDIWIKVYRSGGCVPATDAEIVLWGEYTRQHDDSSEPAVGALTPEQIADLRWTAEFLGRLAIEGPATQIRHYQEQLGRCADWLRVAVEGKRTDCA